MSCICIPDTVPAANQRALHHTFAAHVTSTAQAVARSDRGEYHSWMAFSISKFETANVKDDGSR